jgi:hypothetical protein
MKNERNVRHVRERERDEISAQFSPSTKGAGATH